MRRHRSSRADGRGSLGECGEVGIGILAAVLLTVVVAVNMVYLFAYLYGQAVVRSALDEGVRAGSRISEAQLMICETTANDVVDDLLGGPLGDGIVGPACAFDAAGNLVATATATFDSPLPGVPTWTIDLQATATREIEAAP